MSVTVIYVCMDGPVCLSFCICEYIDCDCEFSIAQLLLSVSLFFSLFCLRVTVIGMTNLLDGFQSDSGAGEEKKCVS